MFCTNYSTSKSFYFHGLNLSEIAIRKMSKGRIRVVGVNWGHGIRRAGILTLNHRKETARLDDT